MSKSKVNVFDLIKSISTESVSHPDDQTVKVDGVKDLPENVQEDTNQEHVDKDIDAEVTNTQTTEPGPENGGGDGTAEFKTAEKEKVHVSTKDLNVEADQNGGRHVDTLPKQAKAKDNLKPSDISTSVEDHSGEDDSLKTMDAAGAETVGEADDLVMDIDAEVEGSELNGVLTQTETDAAVMGKILEDIGQLETAKASVERYLGILDSMERRGVEMSNELRRSISIGLESISSELFEAEIITLEDFRVSNEANGVQLRGGQGELDDDTEFDGARDKTKKGLTGKLKQLYEAVKKAVMRAISAGVDMWNSFMQDTGKISDHLNDLRKRAAKLEGGKPLKIANPIRLTIGSEFVGGSAPAVKNVTMVSKAVLMDWPNKVASTLGEVRQMMKASKTTTTQQIDDKYAQLAMNAFSPFKELSPSDRSKVPSGFLDVHTLRWSGPLPGNKAVYVGLVDTEDSSISAQVKVSFSAIPDQNTSAENVDVETPSGSEATSVVKELQTLISNVKNYREGMVDLKKFVEEVEEDASSSAFAAYMLQDATKGHAIGRIFDIGRAALETNHHLIGYIISTTKAYIGFLEGSLKAESAGDADAIDA